jgi:uncharacterized membrane protein YkoI
MTVQAASFASFPLHQAAYTSEAAGRPLVLAQNNDKLISPSAAARQAMQFGGQVLGIQLRNGNPPVYVVKIKNGGKVQRVRVDARNGRVIGRN